MDKHSLLDIRTYSLAARADHESIATSVSYKASLALSSKRPCPLLRIGEGECVGDRYDHSLC